MFKLYSNLDTKETFLEAWGGSTKHPDARHRFSEYSDRSDVSDLETLVFQWVVHCSSCQLWGGNTIQMLKWILEIVEDGE